MYSLISDQERYFIRSWCENRHIDDIYSIRAILYWIRVKKNIQYSFILNTHNRELYMIICIHISLKFDGYDEMFLCNFIKDLKEIRPDIDSNSHFNMELEILKHLNWDLGS